MIRYCFLLLLSGLALRLPAQTALPDDPLLSDYYSVRELEDLSVLVSFFDGYVIEQTGESDRQRAYASFNKQQANKSDVSLSIPLDTVRAVFARVKLPVWNSIWDYSSVDVYRSRDSLRLIVPIVDLKLHDAYWQFLLALAETDEQIGKYTKTIQQAGSLSPSLYGLYFDRFYEYPVDFTRAANRLVAAVHYLTFYVQMMEHPG